MKNVLLKGLVVLSIVSFISCSQNEAVVSNENSETIKSEPHRYGGWYCPDNLGGFPPVNIKDWKNVPVVHGRMPTKEETQNGTSLIFVDMEKYPNAKALDMTMPKLASYYNRSSNRNELVIIIQAVNVDNDSVVGFRYLNGGNGSSRLNEITFLSDSEIEKIPVSRFVTYDLKIKASQEVIWQVLTDTVNNESLQTIFDKDKSLKFDWRKSSNVNYCYSNSGTQTSNYANKMYGNYYIQNDYLNYNEKFFVSENMETKESEFIMVLGPLMEDYETQKDILVQWAQKVKELSEQKED